MSPTLSVLVIAGTGRPYLADALRSLVAQDNTDWEAIVVDSCTDPGDIASVTAQVAAVPDPRIIPVRYENGGGYPPYASRKWNFGLTHARGALVAFLDDDDMKGPGWVQAMTAPLLADPALAVTLSRGTCVDRRGVLGGDVFNDPSLDHGHLLGANFMTTGQMVVRRAAIDAIGGFDDALGCAEDYDFCLRLAAVGARWALVGGPRCLKRDTGANACYHPDVVTHTQVALRRLLGKQGVIDDKCSRCRRELEPHPENPAAGGWHWMVRHTGQRWEIYCGYPCA